MPFTGTGSRSAQFAQFATHFVKVPVSNRVESLWIRNWQRELVGSVWDADPMPRIAGWCLPRGQGKSTLCAAIAVWVLMTGGESASVDVVAVDERQAQIIGQKCALIVQRNPQLARRVRVYRDRLVVPSRGAVLQVLPAVPAALEGRDALLTIADEIGRIDRDVWQVLGLAAGKREESVLLGIGTPGPTPDNVLASLRAYSLEHPEDHTQVYREHSAAGFESEHGPDCEHCWALANPALDDFLHRDAMRALLPPKMTTAAYRRARLAQHVTENTDPVLPPGVWDSLSTGHSIPEDTDVVLAFDGSYSGTDATVLVAAAIAPTPHIDVIGVWGRPSTAGDDWRVPVLEVEQAIRDACKRYRVKEIACDPYRWQRSLEVLAAEGFPVAEFPQTASRMSTATGEFLTAATNNQLSHSGNPVLASHLAAAVLSEDGRGGRLVKASRSRHAGRIDAAVAAVMAHSRAAHYANRPTKRYASFRL